MRPPLEHAPLAPYCTLRVGGPARFLVEAPDEAAVLAAVDWAEARGLPVRVLGGGSNLVIADEGVDGLVVKIALRGVTARESAGSVEVTAAAGEPWDDFVRHTVEQGWAGLECLSGIPGLVGATPIQNVGAYGQEVSDTLTAARAAGTWCWPRPIGSPPAARRPCVTPISRVTCKRAGSRSRRWVTSARPSCACAGLSRWSWTPPIRTRGAAARSS